MSLGFANAAALGLLVAGLLPVLAHLSRQTPRDRQPFGAMLLLDRVVKRLRRRRRVKDRWLLVARLLAVSLLVGGAIDPSLSLPGVAPEFGGTGRVVLLLDRSMSMSVVEAGSTLLQRARGEAERTVNGLPSGVLVGLVVFGDTAERLTPALTADRERVLSQLAEVQPSFGQSDLRGALVEARRLLGNEPGEVLVLSDQAGPRMVAEARGEITRLVGSGAAIYPIDVGPPDPRNVAVESASWSEGLGGGRVIMRLRNFGAGGVEVPCEVDLPDGRSIPVFVDVPPLGPAEETVTLPDDCPGGVAAVKCDDPDLPSDDARYFHLPQSGASRILLVDGDPGETPTRSEVYFLERALAPWGGAHGDPAIDVTTPVGLNNLDPAVHRVVFLANVADPRAFGPKLADFVRRGGALVIGAGDNVTAGWYNAALSGILPSEFRKPRSVATGGEEDAGLALQLPSGSDPLFAPFARAGRGGFSKVKAHTLLTLEPFAESDDVHTLLAWEGGLPALIERRIGPGRVVVWTGTFDLEWGNLPLQAVFMPLIQRLAETLGVQAGGASARLDATVGREVVVPLPDKVVDAVVTGPDGAPFRSRREASRVVFTPDRPGGWSVGVPSAPPLARIAVNTGIEESDVRRYDSIAAIEQEIEPNLLRETVDLGPWAARLAGLVALVAAIAAGRSGSKAGQGPSGDPTAADPLAAAGAERPGPSSAWKAAPRIRVEGT